MTANKLFDLLNEYSDWDMVERYNKDFEVRIVQREDNDGNLVPLYEIESRTFYGGWDTIYFWPNGMPTTRAESLGGVLGNGKAILKQYNVRDCEGILITQQEYDDIKEYLD
jgi:hypothetical protein